MTRIFTEEEQERGRTVPVLKSQGAYTPPPPMTKKHQEWLMASALLMACMGTMMLISAIWMGLYFTLGGL